VANETLECVRHGITTNDSSGDTVSILKYTGSGTAITMGTDNGRFVGCDLLLGSSATEGVHIGGSHAYSNHIEDASIREGGTGTTLVHISCPGGFCEDNHVAHSRINDFVGKGVSIDNANDTFLYQNTAYGRAAGNTTSIALLIDSGAGGININNFLAGSAGLHGLVIQHTLAGLFPHFIFAHDFESDNAGGDGWLFDSSLQSSNLDATFLDSWAAGSAEAGIHISGGSGITIGGGSRIRVNQHDGILIDVTAAQAEYGTTIADSYIQGNNQANGGFNGISITGHPGPVVIHGNHINNFPEVGGLQQYAVAVTGDVEGLIFSDNDCAQNVTGCLNAPSVIGTKLTYFGNMAPSLGQQPNYFPGGLLTNAASSFFASGTTAMPTGALGANTCSSAVTVATAGVTTAMRIHWNLHSTPVAVNGYGNSPVTINAWLTTGNVNFIQCATTAVTPGAMSVDWVVF
jgi:hypothetical protein